MSYYTEEKLKMNETYEELKECIRDHNIGKIKHLLADFDVNYVFYDGYRSLLQYALSWGRHGNSKVIELLLKHGANVDYKDEKKKTPLMYAVECGGSFENTKLLVEKGADIHAEDHDDCNALCYAMCYDYPKFAILKYLLDNGIRIKHCHLDRDNIQLVELFVKYNSFVDVATEFIDLLWSVEDLQYVKLLVENGCDVNHRSMNGHTLLLWSAEKSKNMELVKYLIHAGVEISQQTIGEIFSVEYAELLMSLGYDVVNHVYDDEQGVTIIHRTDNVELLQYLLRHGATIRHNILFYHVIRDNYDVVKFIIDNKLVDINEKDDEGKTVLHNTVQYHHKMFKLLVNNGADINAKDNDGNLPDDLTSDKQIISFLNKKRLQLRKKRA
ncbi:hypothetical protein PBCV1_A247R [Paramecium bursaria Chlorella virus 1]|uniref:Uncharacterized protein n=1 Tax=Paramecium bursaria Chlorella virus 1 TaxID=10506 RepID=Q84566_PBCV1|nr:hypothetical protein PBCV1_A247R [Paramecium bursaria Chlorella virus 1]AAC96615.1 hypothetical protein [Paramecium bursaria Chlorella virus 1]